MKTTTEIITPIGGHKVIIKTMLTGAEREQVDTSPSSLMKTKDGINFEVTDMRKLQVAQKHELLRISLVSIDGDETDVFDRWHKMYEHDADFVYNEIIDAQKKMTPSTSKTS